MALLTTISDANKDVTQGRVVRFSAEPYVWTDGAGTAYSLYWTITRIAESKYQYIALTKDAAETHAAALQSEYTRAHATWTAELDESTTPPTPVIARTNIIDCTSTIVPVKASGDAWHIDCTIQEQDVVITTEQPTPDNLAELFQLAIARETADDGEASIAIDEAHWDSVNGEITVYYTLANIDNFDSSLMVIQRKQGDSWVNVTTTSVGAGGATFASDQNRCVRAVYASLVYSGSYTTNDAPMPALSMSAGTWSKGVVDTSYAVKLTIPFTATGVPRALAGITNVGRWTVRLTGVQSGYQWSALSPSSVVSLGGSAYAMTVWAPLYSTTENDISVTIVFATSGDGVDSSATATFSRANYVDVDGAIVLGTAPVKTRIRLAVKTDIADYVVARGTWSVAGTYAGVGFTGSLSAAATVDEVYTTPTGYALILAFTTLQYRAADYNLTLSGTFTDSATGLTASFATYGSGSPTISMPARYITGATLNGQDTTVAYTALNAPSSWSGEDLDAAYWDYNNGAWQALPFSSGDGSGTAWTAVVEGADLSTGYLATMDGGNAKSRFACDGAVYTRIVSATCADGEVSIVFDQQHESFDGSLLTIYDETQATSLTTTVTGDVAVAEIAASLTEDETHVLHLIYNSAEISESVSVVVLMDAE